jgi:hypothetical protein
MLSAKSLDLWLSTRCEVGATMAGCSVDAAGNRTGDVFVPRRTGSVEAEGEEQTAGLVDRDKHLAVALGSDNLNACLLPTGLGLSNTASGFFISRRRLA